MPLRLGFMLAAALASGYGMDEPTSQHNMSLQGKVIAGPKGSSTAPQAASVNKKGQTPWVPSPCSATSTPCPAAGRKSTPIGSSICGSSSLNTSLPALHVLQALLIEMGVSKSVLDLVDFTE